MLFIDNDPIRTLFQAVNELHPNLDCDIQYDPTITFEKDGCYAYTEFPNDGSKPVVGIGMEAPFYAIVELIAHELAHVVVGFIENDPHGPEWQKEFDKIHTKCNELVDFEVAQLKADGHEVVEVSTSEFKANVGVH